MTMKWQIRYQGRIWEFDDTKLSMPEARLQKRISGGMTPVAAERARQELDPDALSAALAIARKRAGLPLEEAIVVADDDEEIDVIKVAEGSVAAGLAAATPAEDEAAEIVRAEVADEPAEATPKRARKTAN